MREPLSVIGKRHPKRDELKLFESQELFIGHEDYAIILFFIFFSLIMIVLIPKSLRHSRLDNKESLVKGVIQ
jgi:hypothetical protein